MKNKYKIKLMLTGNIVAIFLFLISGHRLSAQETKNSTKEIGNSEQYGNTLNLGIGVGYYGYLGGSTPVVHADYEFDVMKNLTLAPFISYYSYERFQYWGNPKYPYRDYSYRQTVIPIGVKGTYYFDQLLKANSKWDFYLAGSLGFAYRTTTWESGYYGETYVNHGSSGIYLDVHIGAEYHLSKPLGLYLDLSSGISTFGLAVHF